MEDKSLVGRKITKGVSALFFINSPKVRITPHKSFIPLMFGAKFKQDVTINLCTPFEGIA